MKTHAKEFHITTMARVLKVSKSGFYQWKLNGKKQRYSSALDVEVALCFIKSRKRYGHRKILKQLEAKGLRRNIKTVLKSMKRQRLSPLIPKKFIVTTNSNHNLPVFENNLNRDFFSLGINQKWVGDITYLRTREGWCYLSVYLDLFNRKVVGWAMSENIDANLACKSLEEALIRQGYPIGVIVHTDRGSTYCSDKYRELIKDNGLTGSMSRKGNCWDNAVAESFFGIAKREISEMDKFENFRQAYQIIFEYIECWYNPIRLHSYLGYLSPMEFTNNIKLSKQTVR